MFQTANQFIFLDLLVITHWKKKKLKKKKNTYQKYPKRWENQQHHCNITFFHPETVTLFDLSVEQKPPELNALPWR